MNVSPEYFGNCPDPEFAAVRFSPRAAETGRLIVPVAHNAGQYWPRRALLKKPGFSRGTINAVEHGSMTTTVGAYLSVLWVYGLQREVELLADPALDREGAALTFDVGEKRVKVSRRHAV